MARQAISEVIRIRKAIIALPESDYQDLVRDIEIIGEIREDLAKKAKGVNSEQTANTTEPAK